MKTTIAAFSVFALTALTVTAVAVTAWAADPPKNHNPAMREACASDLASLCAGVAAGQPTMQCLMKNQAKASDGCKQAMAAMRQSAGTGMGGSMGGAKPQ